MSEYKHRDDRSHRTRSRSRSPGRYRRRSRSNSRDRDGERRREYDRRGDGRGHGQADGRDDRHDRSGDGRGHGQDNGRDQRNQRDPRDTRGHAYGRSYESSSSLSLNLDNDKSNSRQLPYDLDSSSKINTDTNNPEDSEEFQPLSEEEKIELRRKMRLEILARLKGENSTPEDSVETDELSVDGVTNLSDVSSSRDLHNEDTTSPVDISSSNRLSVDFVDNLDLPTVAKPSTPNSPGSESDDMFADSEPDPHHNKASTITKLDASMLDNWDDAEGYYRVITGELIDQRYAVSATLGKGMFAAVVRATDRITDTLVAIKIIRNNETMQKAGLKEISILEKLNNSDPKDQNNVVRLLRWFDHKSHLCLVFENLQSNLRDTLKKYGRNVGIDIFAVKAYTTQLLRGLELLKQCEIVHADLKPDNMLVNENLSSVKISDLGSASDISEADITPYLVSRFYRAPELILGLPYNYAIDMWSLGCSLYELYTGHILFPGSSNNNMLKVIMETRGKFNNKMLKKGQFTSQHFDDRLDFLSQEVDKVSGASFVRTIKIIDPLPTKKLRARLAGLETPGEKAQILESFGDLLDKMLILNPDKRISPSEALQHKFCQ